MKHGKKAKRRHCRGAGRTGSIFQKQLASRNVDLNAGRLGLPPLGDALVARVQAEGNIDYDAVFDEVSKAYPKILKRLADDDG